MRWAIVTAYVVLGLIAAYELPRLEYTMFPAYGTIVSVSTAQAFLGAVASGMMALTAIVFSIAVLLIQYTATAYSKRLILIVTRRLVIFHAFGIFVATFSFSLGTLAFVNRNGSNWAPFFSLFIVGALLASSVVILGWLMYQMAGLRVTRVLVLVNDHGIEQLARMPASNSRAPLPAGTPAVALRARKREVLQRFDVAALVKLAAAAGATIELSRAAGDAVYPDTVVALTYGGTVDAGALKACMKFDSEHRYEGDVRFSLRLLVDTAIMALSPAVNDPTTAVQTLDHIEDLALRLAKRDLDGGRAADEGGTLRLIYPVPTWDDYLQLAFDEIRQCGIGSAQVVRRMRSALADIAAAVEDPARRDAVLDYGRRLDEQCRALDLEVRDRETVLGLDPQGLGLTRS